MTIRVDENELHISSLVLLLLNENYSAKAISVTVNKINADPSIDVYCLHTDMCEKIRVLKPCHSCTSHQKPPEKLLPSIFRRLD